MPLEKEESPSISEGYRFVCPHCNKRLANKHGLIRHIRGHTGVKPFKCNVCSKSFADRQYLCLHSRTHSGERPYKCSQCSKRFSSQSNLIQHVKIHKGVRPYECPLCLRRFTQLSGLKCHTRTHSGEKPFSCIVCGRSFAQLTNMKKHQSACTGVGSASGRRADGLRFGTDETNDFLMEQIGEDDGCFAGNEEVNEDERLTASEIGRGKSMTDDMYRTIASIVSFSDDESRSSDVDENLGDYDTYHEYGDERTSCETYNTSNVHEERHDSEGRTTRDEYGQYDEYGDRPEHYDCKAWQTDDHAEHTDFDEGMCARDASGDGHNRISVDAYNDGHDDDEKEPHGAYSNHDDDDDDEEGSRDEFNNFHDNKAVTHDNYHVLCDDGDDERRARDDRSDIEGNVSQAAGEHSGSIDTSHCSKRIDDVSKCVVKQADEATARCVPGYPSVCSSPSDRAAAVGIHPSDPPSVGHESDLSTDQQDDTSQSKNRMKNRSHNPTSISPYRSCDKSMTRNDNFMTRASASLSASSSRERIQKLRRSPRDVSRAESRTSDELFGIIAESLSRLQQDPRTRPMRTRLSGYPTGSERRRGRPVQLRLAVNDFMSLPARGGQDIHARVGQDPRMRGGWDLQPGGGQDLCVREGQDLGVKSFQCPVCKKDFTTMGNLKQHLIIHSGLKPYACLICKRAFSSKGGLYQHSVVHTDNKPHQCDICFKSFNQSGNLRTHRRIHTGEKPYKCQVCGKAFNNHGNMRTHSKTHIKDGVDVSMPTNQSMDSENFQLLERRAVGKSPYKSPPLPRLSTEPVAKAPPISTTPPITTMSSEAVATDDNVVDGSDDDLHLLSLAIASSSSLAIRSPSSPSNCSLVYASSLGLSNGGLNNTVPRSTSHSSFTSTSPHTASTIIRVKSSGTNEQFDSALDSPERQFDEFGSTHRQCKGDDSSKLQYRYDSRQYRTVEYSTKPISMSDDVGRSFTSGVDGGQLSWRGERSFRGRGRGRGRGCRGRRRASTGQYNSADKYLDQSTELSSSAPSERLRETDKFSTSVEAIAASELRKRKRCFLCSICMRNLSSMTSLEQHMATHTGERKYSCTECGRRFTQPGALKAHIRTHTGEKPYVCTLCPKKFAQSGSLDTHLRMHASSSRKFPCETCGIVFARLGVLARHEEAAHGIKRANVFPWSAGLSWTREDMLRAFSQPSEQPCSDELSVQTGSRPNIDPCHDEWTV